MSERLNSGAPELFEAKVKQRIESQMHTAQEDAKVSGEYDLVEKYKQRQSEINTFFSDNLLQQAKKDESLLDLFAEIKAFTKHPDRISSEQIEDVKKRLNDRHLEAVKDLQKSKIRLQTDPKDAELKENYHDLHHKALAYQSLLRQLDSIIDGKSPVSTTSSPESPKEQPPEPSKTTSDGEERTEESKKEQEQESATQETQEFSNQFSQLVSEVEKLEKTTHPQLNEVDDLEKKLLAIEQKADQQGKKTDLDNLVLRVWEIKEKIPSAEKINNIKAELEKLQAKIKLPDNIFKNGASRAADKKTAKEDTGGIALSLNELVSQLETFRQYEGAEQRFAKELSLVREAVVTTQTEFLNRLTQLTSDDAQADKLALVKMIHSNSIRSKLSVAGGQDDAEISSNAQYLLKINSVIGETSSSTAASTNKGLYSFLHTDYLLSLADISSNSQAAIKNSILAISDELKALQVKNSEDIKKLHISDTDRKLLGASVASSYYDWAYGSSNIATSPELKNKMAAESEFISQHYFWRQERAKLEGDQILDESYKRKQETFVKKTSVMRGMAAYGIYNNKTINRESGSRDYNQLFFQGKPPAPGEKGLRDAGLVNGETAKVNDSFNELCGISEEYDYRTQADKKSNAIQGIISQAFAKMTDPNDKEFYAGNPDLTLTSEKENSKLIELVDKLMNESQEYQKHSEGDHPDAKELDKEIILTKIARDNISYIAAVQALGTLQTALKNKEWEEPLDFGLMMGSLYAITRGKNEGHMATAEFINYDHLVKDILKTMESKLKKKEKKEEVGSNVELILRRTKEFRKWWAARYPSDTPMPDETSRVDSMSDQSNLPTAAQYRQNLQKTFPSWNQQRIDEFMTKDVAKSRYQSTTPTNNMTQISNRPVDYRYVPKEGFADFPPDCVVTNQLPADKLKKINDQRKQQGLEEKLFIQPQNYHDAKEAFGLIIQAGAEEIDPNTIKSENMSLFIAGINSQFARIMEVDFAFPYVRDIAVAAMNARIEKMLRNVPGARYTLGGELTPEANEYIKQYDKVFYEIMNNLGVKNARMKERYNEVIKPVMRANREYYMAPKFDVSYKARTSKNNPYTQAVQKFHSYAFWYAPWLVAEWADKDDVTGAFKGLYKTPIDRPDGPRVKFADYDVTINQTKILEGQNMPDGFDTYLNSPLDSYLNYKEGDKGSIWSSSMK